MPRSKDSSQKLLLSLKRLFYIKIIIMVSFSLKNEPYRLKNNYNFMVDYPGERYSQIEHNTWHFPESIPRHRWPFFLN